MSRHRAVTRAFALAVVAWAAVAPDASAQRAAGPFAGLFGGAQSPTKGRSSQQLELRWSMSEGYDDVAQDENGNIVPDSEFHSSGMSGGITAGLGYQGQRGGLRYSLDGQVMARSYGGFGRLSSPVYSGGGAIDVPLSRRTALHGGFNGGFSSVYQFAPFLGVVSADLTTIAPGYGSVAIGRKSVFTSGNAGVSQMLWPRATLSLDGGLSKRSFLDSTEPALEARSARVAFQQSVTRGLGFHAGYSYQQGLFNALNPAGGTSLASAGAGNPTLRNFDFGLDFNFNKAFSVSRRTTFTFGTGSSLVDSDQGGRRFHLTGQASLTQQIGRTWSTNVHYGRGAQLLDGVRNVVFGDSVTAGIQGQLSTRIQLGSALNLTSGTVGVQTGTPHFSAYNVGSRVTIGVSRLFGFFVQHSYYRYDVPLGVPLAVSVQPRLGRQSAMFGISGWVPFLEDSRGRRGSR